MRKAARVVQNNPVLRPLFGDWVFRTRWKTELALLEGKSLSGSQHSSIIHMGLNRSASQWVKSVLRRAGNTVDLVHVRWNEMAFHSEYPYLDHLDEVGEYGKIFRPRGYLYSSFGGYPKGISQLKKYKVVLVVRDPRDLLVSRYFSIAISHPVPTVGSPDRDAFLERRARAKKESIDDFVLRTSQRLRKTYDQYLHGLLDDHPDVHIAQYEDMATNVEDWLADLMSYVEISLPERLRQDILKEAYAVQEKDEDESEHVRKGEPGDHCEKLAPATIDQLNEQFADVLRAFDYQK